MQCQVCESETQEFLDLGRNPACDFLNQEELAQEAMYPLTVHFCPNCGLVQLGKTVDQKALFTPRSGYHHIAALSSSFLKHLDVLAEQTIKRFGLTIKDLVIEIGSNDGALLEAFSKRGMKVLGVDPTDVAEIARKKGLPTIGKFFNERIAIEIIQRYGYGHAKVITALNTFAHVSSLNSVVRGIKDLLTADGVFISENHYSLDLISELQYDFMYHEHSRYYSLHSLVYLFNRFNMDIFDVERLPTHSGSIRVFACKKGAYPISESVTNLLEEEFKFGLFKPETYQEFKRKVLEHQQSFKRMLNGIVAEGKTIAGLTFPARAVTLLNSCNIGPETLCYITELSSIKIGRFSPGTHIKVVDQSVLFGENQPDFGLILSWHIQEELVPLLRKKGFRGKFIVPLPSPRILSS